MKQTPEGRWRGEGADDFHTAIVPQSEGMQYVCVCVCVGIFLSRTIRIPLMVVRVRKKAGYAVYSPFPHRFMFSRFSALIFNISLQILCFHPSISLLISCFFLKAFILYKSDQLIDHFKYISSCVQLVSSLNLQAES